jgi:hypothetical protein
MRLNMSPIRATGKTTVFLGVNAEDTAAPGGEDRLRAQRRHGAADAFQGDARLLAGKKPAHAGERRPPPAQKSSAMRRWLFKSGFGLPADDTRQRPPRGRRRTKDPIKGRQVSRLVAPRTTNVRTAPSARRQESSADDPSPR